MIQKIFLIMFVMQHTRDGIEFIEYLEDTIDTEIKEFLPPGINFISSEIFTDFYINQIIDRVYNINTSTSNEIPDAMTIGRGVLELTFSSEEDLQFKVLPWLERYIGESTEYYDNLGIIFPYLINEGKDYTFRLAYRIVTPFSDDDGMITALDDDFSLLHENAEFIKHHFYQEDIPNECFAQVAKIMLLDHSKVQE